MVQAKCVQKFRDRHGIIYGYTIEDIYGNRKDVTPDDLKNAILNKQIDIVNLKLTSDNRLINKNTDSQLNNIMTNKVEKRESYIEYITKQATDIMNLINKSIETELEFFCDHDKDVVCCGTYYTTLSIYFRDGRDRDDHHDMWLKVEEDKLSCYVYSPKKDIEYNHITLKELNNSNIKLFIDILKKLLKEEFLGDAGEIVISNNTITKNTLYRPKNT
ncbi:MAG: hypothetical protein J6A59_18955 [Lachnospiraceae bacterium]|nr:hypothetical protein [Lachnospiraceae bacterium]